MPEGLQAAVWKARSSRDARTCRGCRAGHPACMPTSCLLPCLGSRLGSETPAPPPVCLSTPLCGSPHFSDSSSGFPWGCSLSALGPCSAPTWLPCRDSESPLVALQGSAPSHPHHHSAGLTRWLRAHAQNHTRVSSYQQEYRSGHTNPLTWLFPGCVLTQRHNLPGFPTPRPRNPEWGVPTPSRCGCLWADFLYHWPRMSNSIVKHSSGR